MKQSIRNLLKDLQRTRWWHERMYKIILEQAKKEAPPHFHNHYDQQIAYHEGRADQCKAIRLALAQLYTMA